MTPGTLIGERFGREVRVSALPAVLRHLSPGALSHATVLIWIDHGRELDSLLPRVRAVSLSAPLVVFTAGAMGGRLFDALLEDLSRAGPLPQVMTRHSEDELDACVEEFLDATWPSEDRVDAWAAYLLVADDRASADALSEAVAARL